MTKISKMKAGALCLCLVLMACGWSFAQSPYLEYYPVTHPSGNNQVSNVLVDREGVKWFGMWRGAVWAFDDKDWRYYELSPGGVMTGMCLDPEGRVWTTLGYAHRLIHYFDGERFHEIPDYSGAEFVGPPIFDSTGTLWMGGLSSWSEWEWWVGRRDASEEWTLWGNPYHHYPTDLDVTSDGTVWYAGSDWDAGAYEHIFKYDESLSNWERFATGTEGYNQDTASSNDGRLWLTKGDLHTGQLKIFYADDWEDWIELQYPDVGFPMQGSGVLTAASDEGLWIGGSCGAFWYDSKVWRWIGMSSSPSDIAIDEFTEDVWFSTRDGVYVMRGGPDAWPPVWIEIEAGVDADAFSLKGCAEFQMELQLDLYVAVQFPDGSLFFAPNWSTTMAPYVPNLSVPIGLQVEQFPLVDFDTTGRPEGTYRWFAACIHAGTMEFASNIASCEWEFVK